MPSTSQFKIGDAIQCAHCHAPIVLRISRDIGRKRFCSTACRVRAQRGVKLAIHLHREARKCVRCEKPDSVRVR